MVRRPVRAPPLRSSGGTLQVKVPPLPHGGTVRLIVETGAGARVPSPSSCSLSLRAVSVDPLGALPGDEVVLAGSGLAEGATVTVGGAAARVVSAEAGALRFEMPTVDGAPGSVQDVVASVGERRTKPLHLYLGRVPLVVSFEPARGVAGRPGAHSRGRLRRHRRGQRRDVRRRAGPRRGGEPHGDGRRRPAAGAPAAGDARPGGRARGRQGLVGRRRPSRSSGSSRAPGCRASSRGRWATAERRGRPTVGTEIAPVLLLSWKDESRSVGERALRVAAALNAVVDRARVGQPAVFEAREQPAIGVALAGAPDLLVQVTPQDAAAYETPPGLPVRGAPPTPVGARPALGRPVERHARDRHERRQAHGDGRPGARGRGRLHPAPRGAALAVRHRRSRARGSWPCRAT